MNQDIRFGTSGWRAVIADGFTFEQARRLVTAIAGHVRDQGLGDRPVLVGYDTRFLMDQFADEAARTLAAAGVPALLCEAAVPTPAISHTVIARRLSGAINFTASHNPPAYGGLKFSTHQGVPSPRSVTRDLEERLAEIGPVDEPPAQVDGVEKVDVREDYLERIGELVDLEVIGKSSIRVAFDPLYGTARGYLDELLRRAGRPCETLHDRRDVLFGGRTPDCSEDNLVELAERAGGGEIDLGVATDGDGDRFAIIDGEGSFVSPNLILALVADYLAESRGWRHGLGRTVATTHLLDAIAAHRGMEVVETPVGFKYLGELLVSEKIYLGGEESAGMSILGHVPEKDGILADLLVLEMVARSGKTLKQLRDDLFARVGALYSRRVDHRLDVGRMEGLRKRLAGEPPAELNGRTVERADAVDGLKLVLEGGAWMLVRPSGTEPVVRQYVEASSETELARLLDAGRRFLLEEPSVDVERKS
jgi:alpha-D-glucose phosphate-specific phosphoglucomutase